MHDFPVCLFNPAFRGCQNPTNGLLSTFLHTGSPGSPRTKGRVCVCCQLGIVVPFDPLPVLGDVPGVEQPAGRRVFAEFLLADGAAVHEGLRDYGQARVDGTRLVDVEDELRVLDHIHPEPQRQTTHTANGRQLSGRVRITTA